MADKHGFTYTATYAYGAYYALVVSGGVAQTAADTGAGTESPAVTAAVTSTDAGAGVEAASVTAAVGAAEGGSGTEAVAIGAVSVGAIETGSGAEATATTAAVGVAETGAGTEGTATAAAAGAVDTGSGSEIFQVGAVPGAGEAGTGTEGIGVSAIVGAAEPGSGAEAVDTTAAVLAAEDGVGAEAVSVFIPAQDQQISVDDSGLGSEGVVLIGAGITGYAQQEMFGTPHSVLPQFRPTQLRIGPQKVTTHIPSYQVGVRDSGTGTEDFTSGGIVNAEDRGTGAEFDAPIWRLYVVGDQGSGDDLIGEIDFTETPSVFFAKLMVLARAGIITKEAYISVLETRAEGDDVEDLIALGHSGAISQDQYTAILEDHLVKAH